MHSTKPAIALSVLLLLGFSSTADSDAALPPKAGFDMPLVQQGRALVLAEGCNDCHTRGYLVAPDSIPNGDWLTGSDAGMTGPWGTLYPTNLRLLLDDLDQEQWVSMSKHVKATPMMPWSNLRKMEREQLVALYEFIRYLGPKGEPAPASQPPG